MTHLLIAFCVFSPTTAQVHRWFQYTGMGYPTVVEETKTDFINEASQQNMTTSTVSVNSGHKDFTKPNVVSGDNPDPGPPWAYPFTPFQPNGTLQLSVYWPQQITQIPGLHTYVATAKWNRTWGDDKWGCLDHPTEGPYERHADRYTFNSLLEELIDNGSPF